ncbi:hypothetical protein ACC691_39190, partial [Rhizobium johnstonii]|uniref:hypothetical protein n=1 Tax=Rhizobium johnstonii TaxID=3019933 RepID=UPI003F9B2116
LQHLGHHRHRIEQAADEAEEHDHEVLQRIAEWTPVYGIGEIARAPLTGDGFDLGALLNALAWLAIFVIGTALLFRRDTKRV